MLRAAILALVFAGASAQATPIDHQHDFDFEFGNWNADVKVLAHPFAGSHTYLDFRGTSDVHPIWSGRGNYGELEIGDAQRHIEGLTLRLYHPQTRNWYVYFSNSANGDLGVPAIGRFENGRGVFEDTEPIGGRPTRVRFVFSDITPHSFHFIQSFSIDGGKTWEQEWISTFTR
jgi:hypothetical protein